MDCSFHNAVSSIATCRDCARTVCATCRGTDGSCPSCRLAAKIDAAAGPRERLRGGVGPSSPPPQRPRATATARVEREPELATMPGGRAPALGSPEPVETRALVALGYPFWPLAALAFALPRRSTWAKRQALQGLAFNFGSAVLWATLAAVANIPLLGISAWPLLVLAPMLWLLGSIVFAIKAAHGDDVHVPFVSDWLDDHESWMLRSR